MKMMKFGEAAMIILRNMIASGAMTAQKLFDGTRLEQLQSTLANFPSSLGSNIVSLNHATTTSTQGNTVLDMGANSETFFRPGEAVPGGRDVPLILNTVYGSFHNATFGKLSSDVNVPGRSATTNATTTR